MSVGADVVEVICALCSAVMTVPAVPDRCTCRRCGVTLEAVIVTIVHRVTTTHVVTDFDGEDLTPVADVIPLPPIKETG